EEILHIPTCASSSHGLLSLNNQALVASQAHKHGSLGGGAIFTWPLNKPQVPIRSYPIEAIGPICCTRDGIYLAGGSPSGNAYIWEVSSGRLLKSWRANHKSLSCVIFSSDDSLFIAGSDDGTICSWSMVSLLDVTDTRILPPIFHVSWDHSSTITGLLSPSSSASSSLMSSSLDGTCKVWDPASGRLLRTRAYPLAITTIVLDPGEQLLFAGSADGRIFADMLDLGLNEDPFVVAVEQSTSRVLNGHK
ncbi:WD40 repeat, partial [Dillenia turbinata]